MFKNGPQKRYEWAEKSISISRTTREWELKELDQKRRKILDRMGKNFLRKAQHHTFYSD
jgi:hypothetical protein